MTFDAPHIDYAGLSPVIALTAGVIVVLLAGLVGGRRQRFVVAGVAVVALAAAAGLLIWQWSEPPQDLVADALVIDDLSVAISLIAVGAAAFVTPLMIGEAAATDRHGDYLALLLCSVLGMVLLSEARNLIALFVSLELLSIPLYVLCGSALRREQSLESGLKYLIVGSVGSATLLYGLAFIYGGSSSTDFVEIRDAIQGGLFDDPLILIGIGLAATGLAFKASLAPFHQWTPDVYQGAPTPVTAFMSVATKAAAFAVFVRLFQVALGPSVDQWQPALAAIAVLSIAVGNIGALGQDSLKRMLGYSGIAQAGYILVGLVVASGDGLKALVFYLIAYALMNLPAFAVILIRERETRFGDDIRAVQGIGADRPALAWPLTISMLALSGLPGTVGFIGKLYLIEAAARADYTWLGVAIVIGTMVSLAYYLRVVAAVWMRPAATAEPEPATDAIPAIAGGSPEADAAAPSRRSFTVILVPTAIVAAAVVFFGIYPDPLVEFASQVGLPSP